MAADENSPRPGDQEYDLLRKILNRLAAAAGGGGTISTDITLGGASPSDALYPSQKAAKTYIDGGDAAVASAASAALTAGLATKQNSLGYTAENSANKDTDGTLAANSDVKYASQKATKTYADTKQSALGFTPENVANKDTDGTLAANSDVKYASQKATKTYADTKQAALGFTPENVANKDTDGTLAANSDTKYASQKATKTYVDTGLATKQKASAHSTLTYASTTDLDFNGDDYRTVTLTGVITFTTSNRGAPKALTIRIVGDSSSRALTFPAWVFIGAAAPTALAANKTAILSITCFGANDTDIIAAYSVQP